MVLTERHLGSHGLDAETYREKFGFKKGTLPVCNRLPPERCSEMKDMKPWERRGKKAEAAASRLLW